MPDLDTNIKEFIDSATICVDTVGGVKRSDILSILRDCRFCRISGLLSPDSIRRSRELLSQYFDPENDHPVYGDTPDDVQDNFQKLSIGRARHGGVDRPRFMRVFYNPIWADNIYELRDTFTRIAQVRNILADLPRDFAIDKVEGGMWTASRVHLFPTGGGFMVTHKDTVLPAVLEQNGFDGGYFQPLALFSQKGVDYKKGGGTIEVQGEIIEYEDYTKLGDIIVYDATTSHGVNDIDPDLPFKQHSLAGRMSALVTLYKDLKN